MNHPHYCHISKFFTSGFHSGEETLLYSWQTLFLFFLQDCGMYCMQVKAYSIMLSPHLSVTDYLFTLLFLSKQTRRGRNIVSFYFFCLYVVALSVYRASHVWLPCAPVAVCRRISNGDHCFVWSWTISVNVRDSRSRELNSVQFICINIISLLMPNKFLHTLRGDYWECVRPAQLPVLTEVRTPSLLEQYPRYVPHWDRAGYNRITWCQMRG